MKVTIYGASDDLIEVDGDIGDEFGCSSPYLHFDDGTVIHVGYCEDGYHGWKVNRIKEGSATFTFVRAAFEDEDSDEAMNRADDGEAHSDVVTLEGDFTRVDAFDEPDGPSRQWLIDHFEDFDFRDKDTAVLKQIYMLAR